MKNFKKMIMLISVVMTVLATAVIVSENLPAVLSSSTPYETVDEG
jgi:signal peptidase I